MTSPRLYYYPRPHEEIAGGTTVRNAIMHNLDIPEPQKLNFTKIPRYGFLVSYLWSRPHIPHGVPYLVLDQNLPIRNVGIPQVIYVHCPVTVSYPRTHSYRKPLRGHVRAAFCHIMLKRLRRNNVHIICNAKWNHAVHMQYGCPNVYTVYPPCDIPPINDIDTYGRSGVISIGRLVPYKNHDFCGSVCYMVGERLTVLGAHNNTETKPPTYFNSDVIVNAPSSILDQQCRKHKCIISGVWREDFGIAVVEGVARGCIPVVPDAYGFRETVPFDVLRYKPGDMENAADVLRQVLRGSYDDYIPKLLHHIQQYDKRHFADGIHRVIRSIL